MRIDGGKAAEGVAAFFILRASDWHWIGAVQRDFVWRCSIHSSSNSQAALLIVFDSQFMLLRVNSALSLGSAFDCP